MSRSPYGWEPGSPPPIIQQHSIAKHEILRAYLSAYIRTLVSDPNRDEFRLVLVDGKPASNPVLPSMKEAANA
jgi:hypothetical protein